MSILLVAYDLLKPGQYYSGFYDVTKSYPLAKLSESSYAIETNNTPSSIRETLKPYMDKNDQVYIITLKAPWNGWGPQDINDWLGQRL